MEIKYSREFIKLVETGNYMKAAEELYMAQSTLSKHIQFLERDYNRKLFERNTRNVTLTDFGKAYLPYAIKVAEIERQFERDLLSQWERSMKVIKVGTFHYPTPCRIPEMIQRFSNSNDEYDIKLIFTEMPISLHMLWNNKCDFIFVRDIDTVLADCPSYMNMRIEWFPYCKDPLLLIVPEHHPLAQREKANFEELKDEPFVTLWDKSLVCRIFSRECASYGFEPKVVGTYLMNETLLEAVEAGNGITTLPESSVSAMSENMSANRLQTVEFQVPIYMNVSVVYDANRQLTAESKALLNYFRSVASVDK